MENFEGIVWGKLKPDDKIYRIISFERLTELLLRKRNTLVRPSKWPDTFEDLLGQAIIKSEMPSIGRFKGAEYYYGQCWTLLAASDAIWQIYSNGTDGYRVRTTVRKLLTSLKSQVLESGVRCHIGRVQYMTDKGLVEFGINHFQSQIDSLSEKIAEAYMVKRNAFRHENEVRLIYCLDRDAQESQGLFKYGINPNRLFDQIMLHPGLSPEVAADKKAIIKKLGYEGDIKRSLLYAPPKKYVFDLRVQ